MVREKQMNKEERRGGEVEKGVVVTVATFEWRNDIYNQFGRYLRPVQTLLSLGLLQPHLVYMPRGEHKECTGREHEFAQQH